MGTELEHYTKRVQQDWERMAKEPIEVERCKGAYYGFGSELATLRLLQQYRDCKHARAGFSKNLNKFYFVLETPDIDFDNDGKLILNNGE